MRRLASAVVLAAFILGAASASTILLDQPFATATPMWAQEPPQPPQLSDDERQALDDEKAGRPVKDPKVLSSAKAKQQTAETYKGERNAQNNEGGRADDEFSKRPNEHAGNDALLCVGQSLGRPRKLQCAKAFTASG